MTQDINVPAGLVSAVVASLRSIVERICDTMEVEVSRIAILPGWPAKGARTREKGKPDEAKQPFWVDKLQNGETVLTISWDLLALAPMRSIVGTVAHALSVAAVAEVQESGALKFYPAGWSDVAKKFGLTGERSAKYAIGEKLSQGFAPDELDKLSPLAEQIRQIVKPEGTTPVTIRWAILAGDGEPIFFRLSEGQSELLNTLLTVNDGELVLRPAREDEKPKPRGKKKTNTSVSAK